MRKTELMSIRGHLLAQRSSIMNKSFEFNHDRRDFSFLSKADEAEVASHDVDLSLSYQFQERDRSLLMRIDRALSKITEGTYGDCESCGAEISDRRLKARPFAEFCIDCQEEQEGINGHLL
jgi:DnaK suppressor protein